MRSAAISVAAHLYPLAFVSNSVDTAENRTACGKIAVNYQRGTSFPTSSTGAATTPVTNPKLGGETINRSEAEPLL